MVPNQANECRYVQPFMLWILTSLIQNAVQGFLVGSDKQLRNSPA